MHLNNSSMRLGGEESFDGGPDLVRGGEANHLGNQIVRDSGYESTKDHLIRLGLGEKVRVGHGCIREEKRRKSGGTINKVEELLVAKIGNHLCVP